MFDQSLEDYLAQTRPQRDDPIEDQRDPVEDYLARFDELREKAKANAEAREAAAPDVSMREAFERSAYSEYGDFAQDFAAALAGLPFEDDEPDDGLTIRGAGISEDAVVIQLAEASGTEGVEDIHTIDVDYKMLTDDGKALFDTALALLEEIGVGILTQLDAEHNLPFNGEAFFVPADSGE